MKEIIAEGSANKARGCHLQSSTLAVKVKNWRCGLRDRSTTYVIEQCFLVLQFLRWEINPINNHSRTHEDEDFFPK